MGSNVSKEVPCNNGGESSCSSTDDGLTNNTTNDKTHHHQPEESNNDNEQQSNLPPEVWAGIYECKKVPLKYIPSHFLHHTTMYTICSLNILFLFAYLTSH